MISPFRGFFIGRAVSLLGSSMASVALALAVLQVSGHAADLGIVLAAQILPQLALLLVGGAVADRFSRRAVLIIANLGAGTTQAAVAVVVLSGHYDLPLVACLELANGALEAFASPAMRGIVPELVPDENLQRANSLLATVQNATRIAGPTLAGLVAAGFGGGWALLIDALSFLIAAFFVARLKLTSRAPQGRASLLKDIREGWRAFASRPWVWSMSLSFCVINLVYVGPWNVLGPLLTSTRGGDAAWGIVLSVRAAGMLVMSVLMYRLRLRRPLRSGAIFGGLAALPLFALGLSANTWLLATCAFVGALGFAMAGITWEVSLQQNVSRTVLSRVASYDDLLSYCTIPLGQLLVGPLAASFGGPQVAFWCGCAYLVASFSPLLVTSVRQLSGKTEEETAPVTG